MYEFFIATVILSRNGSKSAIQPSASQLTAEQSRGIGQAYKCSQKYAVKRKVARRMAVTRKDTQVKCKGQLLGICFMKIRTVLRKTQTASKNSHRKKFKLITQWELYAVPFLVLMATAEIVQVATAAVTVKGANPMDHRFL